MLVEIIIITIIINICCSGVPAINGLSQMVVCYWIKSLFLYKRNVSDGKDCFLCSYRSLCVCVLMREIHFFFFIGCNMSIRACSVFTVCVRHLSGLLPGDISDLWSHFAGGFCPPFVEGRVESQRGVSLLSWHHRVNGDARASCSRDPLERQRLRLLPGSVLLAPVTTMKCGYGMLIPDACLQPWCWRKFSCPQYTQGGCFLGPV